MKAFRHTLSVLFVGTLMAATSARAQVDSLKVFELTPILFNGRVMPIDTFARMKLLALSGRSTFERGPASAWLAHVLFTPEQSRGDKVFLVNNPEVAEAIGLPPLEGRARYSYAQLEPVTSTLKDLAFAAWNLDDDARSPVERELVSLYNNLVEYTLLAEAFDFAIPQADLTVTDPELRADLGLEGERSYLSYLDVAVRSAPLNELLSRYASLPREDWKTYHKELFGLAEAMAARQAHRHEALLKILPLPGHGNEVWLSPWNVVEIGARDEALRGEIEALNDMVLAYRDGKQVPFDLAARTFMASVAKRAPNAENIRNLKLELRYNKSKAFYRAELLYGLAFIIVLLSIMYDRRFLYVAALVLVMLALLPHSLGILARMKIMGRPPVTNLYATFIFVGWVSAMLGLAVEYFQRNRLGLLIASVSGLALLLTSGRFVSEGDTMGVMVAVLDSNFWLATHVVAITIGYSGCCVAGLIGHIYLIQAIFRSPGDGLLKETQSTLFGALAFGLIFSFLGTMLGGIWADQSWGRFWGWDPKENGALVIVLWSAVLFHARAAKMIGPIGFAAGCVAGVVWVLLAWLGVNLLGVGLHSYGFTSGLARGLLIACAVELLFIAAVVPFTRRSPGSS